MNLNFDNSTILDRRITLEHNQTWEHPVTYVLNHTGDEQKLEFLLYKEDNFTAPYRDLHLWVNVSSREEPIAGAIMVFPENATLRIIPNMNISPNFPPLDSGSGGSGSESYSMLSTGLSRSPKAEKQNVTNTANAVNASAMLVPSANKSRNISEGNRSKTLQSSNLSYLANVSMASGGHNTTPSGNNITIRPAVNLSANRFMGNLSKAMAQNASYNATSRSQPNVMKPAVQTSLRSNIAPVQLSNETHIETFVIGRNSSQMMHLG